MALKKPPTHIAYALRREGRASWRWLEIGVATKDEDGKGFQVSLDRLPIGGFNGRIAVREKDSKPGPVMPTELGPDDDGN